MQFEISVCPKISSFICFYSRFENFHSTHSTQNKQRHSKVQIPSNPLILPIPCWVSWHSETTLVMSWHIVISDIMLGQSQFHSVSLLTRDLCVEGITINIQLTDFAQGYVSAELSWNKHQEWMQTPVIHFSNSTKLMKERS